MAEGTKVGLLELMAFGTNQFGKVEPPAALGSLMAEQAIVPLQKRANPSAQEQVRRGGERNLMYRRFHFGRSDDDLVHNGVRSGLDGTVVGGLGNGQAAITRVGTSAGATRAGTVDAPIVKTSTSRTTTGGRRSAVKCARREVRESGNRQLLPDDRQRRPTGGIAILLRTGHNENLLSRGAVGRIVRKGVGIGILLVVASVGSTRAVLS
mmetsp:Transcript_26784/g.62673  ORF Transcript_26784/g.62673 Transcript_26784/m.62673 type:complete len:209 (+) Transcript_26784:1351-1977(+)